MQEDQNIFHEGGDVGFLLIHGLAGTPKEMDSIGRRLHRAGFTVSIPVLAGHCADTAALLACGRKDWYKSIDDAYKQLAARSRAVFVGGLSAGALMSVLVAHKYPKVKGIIMYSTTLRWDGWSVPKAGALLPYLLRIPPFRNRYRFAEAFPYGIKNENLRERIVMRLQSGDTSAAGHTDTPGSILYEMLRIGDEAKKVMPQVKTPALIVHAQEDDLAGISNARTVEKLLGGPKRMLILEDSYHLVTIDQERNTVAR